MANGLIVVTSDGEVRRWSGCEDRISLLGIEGGEKRFKTQNVSNCAATESMCLFELLL